MLCVIGAHTIRGDARSEHLVVVTFLIAGIAIMKLRYERYDFLLFSLILLICFVIYFFKAYFNLFFFLIMYEQNSLETNPLDRHDIPRHEIEKVCKIS